MQLDITNKHKSLIISSIRYSLNAIEDKLEGITVDHYYTEDLVVTYNNYILLLEELGVMYDMKNDNTATILYDREE